MLRTENVEQMKNVYSQVNVFVRRHSFWIQVTEANVKIRANDTLVALTRDVLHQIHRSVCAKLDLKEIHYKAVSMKMVCNRIYFADIRYVCYRSIVHSN